MPIIWRQTFSFNKLPSEKLIINHIFAIALSSILIVPTLLLNAVAVITILKSKLRSRPCYYFLFLQSMFDLAVGMLGILSFIFLLTNSIGGISNCTASAAYAAPRSIFGASIDVYSSPSIYRNNDCDDNRKIHWCITPICLQN